MHSAKPVVLVGAMRPATGMSADGPLNLYNAVAVAADKNAQGRGVMVCMNDLVLDAKDVIKSNTTSVDTFKRIYLWTFGLYPQWKSILWSYPYQQTYYRVSFLCRQPKSAS